jgi:SAM-dependent methyltransferase
MMQAWSRYWARETSGACLPGAPPAVQSVLIGAWGELGRGLPAAAQVLDVAAGGGAVLKILLETANRPALFGIDSASVSPAAAALGVRGGIDASQLPFGDASFDVVTSQFGLEYCPQAAWTEAARVLKPGGQLQLICHHRDSAAVHHNGARLAAMQAMAQAGLFALAALVARGQPEDPVLAARVRAARMAHAAQSVVEELPMALGQWAHARRPDAIAAIRAEAEAEMARLAAMQAAALDAAGITARLAWLPGVRATAEVLGGPDGPIGWLVRGNRA